MLPAAPTRGASRRAVGPSGPSPAGTLHTCADDASRLPLVLRVPAATAVSVLLCLAGHVAGGGAMPSASVTVLVAGAIWVLWSAVSRRELGLVPLVGLVWGAQLSAHLLLSGAHEHAAHHHLEAASAGAAGGSDAWMVTTHAVAGLAAAWWLRRGERHAWRLARRTVARVVRLVHPGPSVVPLPRLRRWGHRPRVAALHSLMAPACPVRRGPPLGLACV